MMKYNMNEAKKEEIKIMLAKLTQTTLNVYISNDTKMVLKLLK